ncbi:MAG: hypothetical protein KF916_03960 [Microbacteriaceae bacterium]|nr:hypothetical protein [Microbacteriaceae bacterium]
MAKVANVQLESPLIALDRLFDYLIPEEFESIVIPGVRVQVPLRSQILNGFIVSVQEESNFSGKLDKIEKVISPVQVLQPEIYKLATELAKRYVSTVSAILKLAIPNRSVRVEKQWLKQQGGEHPAISTSVNIASALQSLINQPSDTNYIISPTELISASARVYLEPRGYFTSSDSYRPWIAQFAQLAAAVIANQQSVIICVPSWREITELEAYFHQAGLEELLVRTDTKQTPPERYQNFLNALQDEPKILLGNRSVLLAPAKNLGAILVWDEADSAHDEMMTPYYTSSIVAMQRAQLQQCALVFSSHSRSTEIQRLLDLGWLVPIIPKIRRTPKVVIDESNFSGKIPGMSFAGIRDGLNQGSVLIQVRAGRNQSSGEYGTSELAAEMGKAFPGKRVMVSDALRPLEQVPERNTIVISAIGSEPKADSGYQAIVLLDGMKMLARDGLRVREESIRIWMNAASLIAESGKVFLVNVDGSIGRSLVTWNSERIAKEELQSRIPLGMPPVRRSVSVFSSKAKLRQVEALLPKNCTSFWVPDNSGSKLVVLFDYKIGEEMSSLFRNILVKDSAGSRVNNADKIRVRFDDPEVF